MKINFKACTEEELWKYVAIHLKKNGIDSVLVGGAVVSIYSDGAYESGDLDFVLTDMFVKNLPTIMSEIGFVKKGGRHYEHPECKHLYVEFPSSFLEIGDDNQIKPDEIVVEKTKIKIKILSPTDCVRDRLAGLRPMAVRSFRWLSRDADSSAPNRLGVGQDAVARPSEST
jgi:hypothetical protein